MTDLSSEALQQFRDVTARAAQLDLREPSAIAVATVASDGAPHVRMVLLRGFDEQGFVFYTNSRSQKGKDLAHNPRAAVCVYFDALQEQVRVEGAVEIVSDAESDRYWQQRSRASQLASTASQQSDRLPDRNVYEAEVARLEQDFAGQPVPRPAHWQGYRVIPNRIEFWVGQEARMHDRTVYELLDGEWQCYKLYP